MVAGPSRHPPGLDAHRQRPRRPRRRRPRRPLVRLDPAGLRTQRGTDGLPHRGPPDRPGPQRARLGQRHGAVGSSGIRRLRGTPLAADAAYEWTVQPRGAAGRWGPVSTPTRFTTALRAADWQAQWLHPAGNSQQPDRVTYLRTEVTPSPGALRRATAYVSAAHTYRLYVDGMPVDAWPSFSYPDEQYVRAVDLTSTLAGRQDQRHRRVAPVVRTRPGQARLIPRAALPAFALVRRWPAPHIRFRWLVA